MTCKLGSVAWRIPGRESLTKETTELLKCGKCRIQCISLPLLPLSATWGTCKSQIWVLQEDSFKYLPDMNSILWSRKCVELKWNQKLAQNIRFHSKLSFDFCTVSFLWPTHLMFYVTLPTHTHTHKCSPTDRRSTKRGETQRVSQLTYSRAEWWPAGRKSIAGGETPSKLSMGPTSRYCRQDLIHKAGVSHGTKREAGGSSLISFRALNYRGPSLRS